MKVPHASEMACESDESHSQAPAEEGTAGLGIFGDRERRPVHTRRAQTGEGRLLRFARSRRNPEVP